MHRCEEKDTDITQDYSKGNMRESTVIQELNYSSNEGSNLEMDITASLKMIPQERTIGKLHLKRKQEGFLIVFQHKYTKNAK